ncbi:MAG TPA: MarR family transcriptional regulator [Actinomycetota bacterium]|jgi:DNA-binding MarR family transcriptional regulator
MDEPRSQQVLAALRALSTEIDLLDQVAAERYGLSAADMRSLDVLGQLGPLSPTELARRVGFTTGGITTVIDRLERAGYVRRVADPGDRRRLLVETTAKTAERDREVFGGLARTTLQGLSAYSEPELAVIQDFLERTRAITARHAADLVRQARSARDRRTAGGA